MGSGPGSSGSRSSLESVSMSAVSYRPATLADAELAADVMTSAYPAMPQDPVIMRLRWESPRKGFAHGRFIAERDGAPIGYLGWLHGPWGKLLELSNLTAQDVPHTLPIIDETYEDFARRMEAPDRPHDRIWIALHDNAPVSLSYLKFPPVRGTVWTSYTCTHPGYRGRGLARAVKLQGLAQAVELGVPVVCTDNDSENAPMLHINEQLGYVARPGFVEHHKRVTK